jgi:regulation of enolase protein 1 (concanavalin A-like superfamily)
MTLLLLVLLVAAAAAEGDVIDEAFENDPQSPPWRWVREERDAHRVEDGKLQIRALNGTLWKAQPNDAKNLLVCRLPPEAGDDLAVSVTVNFAPERGGEQAGVMFYFGDDDYVKLVRESLEGKRWIVMGREEKGSPQQIAKVTEEANEVTLVFRRKGGAIEGSYTVAGKDERHVIGTCPDPAAPAPDAKLHLCVFAHGGPPAAAETRWATFSNLSVTKLTK